jgi:hypothetical protein
MRRRSAARDATAAAGPKLVTEDATADSRYMTSWVLDCDCCTCFVSSKGEEECNAAAESGRDAVAVEEEDGEERDDDRDGGGMEGAAEAAAAVE